MLIGSRSLKSIEREIDQVDSGLLICNAFAFVFGVVALCLIALAIMDAQSGVEVLRYGKKAVPRMFLDMAGSILSGSVTLWIVCGPASARRKRLTDLKAERTHTAGLTRRGSPEHWVSDRQRDAGY